MDRISKICFCVILIGIYWIAIADSQAQCTEVRYLDKCEVCSEDKRCPRCEMIQNGECGHDNRCRCKKGYGTDRNGRCVKANRIANYNQKCDVLENIFCNETDFSVCFPPFSGNGKCMCRTGYLRDEEVGQCISPAGLILDVCSASAQSDTCKKVAGLKCDKVKLKCLVQKGYKYNCQTEKYERGTKEHGQACDEDSCSMAQPGCDPCNPDNHLVCKNGACDCKSGYTWVPNQRKCIAGSEQPGAECDAVKQCDPNGYLECKDGFCACIDRYALDETTKKCVKLPCHDQDCSKFMCDPSDTNMVCNPETTKCECKEGYEFHTVLEKCVKYSEYNESCGSNNNCNPKSNLVCNNETVCVCKEGLFEYDEDEKRCVICEEEEEGATLEGALIAILVAVYVGVLGEVGLIVWLCRRNRRVSPGDEEEGKKIKKSEGRRDTKSKRRSTQIKERKESKKASKIKIEP